MNASVLGNIYLLNLYLPLIQAGRTKKVALISTGMADAALVNEYELEIAPIYAISKAAVNMVIAKFNAQYKKDGVLFLAISPGVVEVGRYDNIGEQNPEKAKAMMGMFEKFKSYEPSFEGMMTTEESVKKILGVVEKSSVEKDGGAFLSHLGTKRWL
jgi:NAD(P)-dependent dehydrogenase (short-subunit alcohol dehydrogenase family)